MYFACVASYTDDKAVNLMMSDRFCTTQLPLRDLTLIQRLPINDVRGFFERVFCADTFAELGVTEPIAQVNFTLTKQCGTVRGMHYQNPPHAEIKFVSCLRGEVFDVAIDLRAGSPTFLCWHGEILSQDNRRSLLIPKGFAHGFQTLVDDCELLYFHSNNYAPESESGICPTDPQVNVLWPQPIAKLSKRDTEHTPLSRNYKGIIL